MSETIEPAATPEQWSAFRDLIDAVTRETGERPEVAYIGDDVGAAVGIAFNNDLLPDSDPRKITRAWVEALRKEYESEWRGVSTPNGGTITGRRGSRWLKTSCSFPAKRRGMPS